MIKKEYCLKILFLGQTKTKNENYFFDFLLKNSKIITLFCNKLDYPKNIKSGEEWEITFVKNKIINTWLFGNLIKKSENNSNWFICFNEWIRQILQINKINSIYRLYLLSTKIDINKETAILIDLFLKLLKKLGYSFNFKKCNFCKNNVEIGFLNFDEGGILCYFCKKREKQTFHLPTLIKNIKNNNINNNISLFQEKELKLFLKNLISFINNRCGFFKKLI